jgi:hypothetical protein
VADVVDIMAGTHAMVEVIFAIVVMAGGSTRFSCSMNEFDRRGRWAIDEGNEVELCEGGSV